MWAVVEGRARVQTLYPLQEPLGPAAQAVNSDPHLGEWSDVQDLHEEGVILLPFKSGGAEQGHEKGKLAVVRGPGCVTDRFRVRREQTLTQPPSQFPLTPQ